MRAAVNEKVCENSHTPPSTSQELQHVMQINSITLSYKLPSEVFTMLNTLVTLNTQVSSQSHDQHVT